MQRKKKTKVKAARTAGGDRRNQMSNFGSLSLFMLEPLFALSVGQRKEPSGCQVPDSCRPSSSLPTPACQQQQLLAKISCFSLAISGKTPKQMKTVKRLKKLLKSGPHPKPESDIGLISPVVCVLKWHLIRIKPIISLKC